MKWKRREGKREEIVDELTSYLQNAELLQRKEAQLRLKLKQEEEKRRKERKEIEDSLAALAAVKEQVSSLSLPLSLSLYLSIYLSLCLSLSLVRLLTQFIFSLIARFSHITLRPIRHFVQNSWRNVSVDLTFVKIV